MTLSKTLQNQLLESRSKAQSERESVHELAIQIEESFKNYGSELKLRYTVIFGGVNQNPQVNRLRQGIDILVATPGRLLDLINQGFITIPFFR